MKRQLLDKLAEWKDKTGRKPLVLEGARQVGKTYLIREIFGRNFFENVVYVNMQNPVPEVVEAFERTLDPKKLVANLEILLHTQIKPGKTLLFFDEVQEVPRALTSLKYFYEEAPEYHVVVAGSLLGVFLHQGVSYPVGKVDVLRLEPMSFEEFLWAKGRGAIIDELKKDPGNDFFGSTLLEDFREYLLVGGMPEAVKSWIGDGDVIKVDEIQQKILMNYRNDFSKHVDGVQAIKIRQVFDSLPSQFAKANEKFVYSAIKASARAREYENAIEWLVDAGVVRRVRRVERGDLLPLKAYADFEAFKLYFLDVGLFRQLAEIPSGVVLRKNAIFDQFNGLMAEQFVLQELARDYKMYYWTSEARAEVDFVTQVGDKIIPIEVKSGENVRAQSLKVYREKYKPDFAVRFSLKGYRRDAEILNIPLYESFLAKEIIEDY